MKTRIISTILVFLVLTIKAQEKTITGIVKDSTRVLPGVIVQIKGTTIGTETDFDGKYSIKANLGDILQFKYLDSVLHSAPARCRKSTVHQAYPARYRGGRGLLLTMMLRVRVA